MTDQNEVAFICLEIAELLPTRTLRVAPRAILSYCKAPTREGSYITLDIREGGDNHQYSVKETPDVIDRLIAALNKEPSNV